MVQKAILFSAGLMTAFGAAGILLMVDAVKRYFWGAKRYEEVPEELVHGQPESRADALVAGGMCYFMIGFGTQVGGYSSPIDFIFFLGVGIGLVTIVVYNPIAYNVFRLTRMERF